MEALPSKLLERTVEEFSKLPGVGKQTALRFALHLLRQNKSDVALFTSTIDQMMADIQLCKHCHWDYAGLYSVRDVDGMPDMQTPEAIEGAERFAEELFEKMNVSRETL